MKISFIKFHTNSIRDFTIPHYVLCEFIRESDNTRNYIFKPMMDNPIYPTYFMLNRKPLDYKFDTNECYCIKIVLASHPSDSYKDFRIEKAWQIK